MEKLKSIVMEVIPEPEKGTATVLISRGRHPLFVGSGDINYICGSCDNILARQVEQGMLINLVLQCPACGAFNHVRGLLVTTAPSK